MTIQGHSRKIVMKSKIKCNSPMKPYGRKRI